MQDEKDKEGHVVKKHTLTYQSGRFAGSPHGREEHGYIRGSSICPIRL
jgi:hypothetical protein